MLIEMPAPMVRWDVNATKVLHIIAVQGIGGAENLLVTLLPALQAQMQQVSCLICYQANNGESARSIGEKIQAKGVTVFYAAYSSVFERRIFSSLTHFIQQHQPQLIHVHLKQAEVWLAILKWRKKIRVPIITTLHGYRDTYHNRFGLTWNAKAKFSFYYWLTKFIANHLDGFVSISRGIEQLFRKSGIIKNQPVAVIHHGTETTNQLPLQIGAPRPDLVIIGRLVKFKGHRYAIEAVKELQTKYPAIQLHLYGVGQEETSLKEIAQALGVGNRVIFHGFQKEVAKALRAHSIALVPSVGEPFGLVFFDAFQAGLPVVAFDVPASNEIIEHGFNGLLAKPANSVSLANEVDKLLQDDNLYRKIICQACQKMRDDFSIEQMTADYLAFYKEILVANPHLLQNNKAKV